MSRFAGLQYLIARSVAPELVTADNILELDLQGDTLDALRVCLWARAVHEGPP